MRRMETTYHPQLTPAGLAHAAPSGIGTQFPISIANIAIDHSSPVPLYEQICRALRTAIAAGDLPPGTSLPTSRELGQALRVARNTAVTAYSRLAAEGYIVSNKRRGTRVAESSLSRVSASTRKRNADPIRLDEGSFCPKFEISFRARQLLDSRQAAGSRSPAGVPDSSLYPRVPLGRLLADEFHRPPVWESNDGMQKFQSAVASLLRHMRGVRCEPEQIIAVHGFENALELASRVTIDPGHCVWLEEPAAPAVAQCFRAAGAQIVPIPCDLYGADVARASGPPPRLVFVSPSANVPLGRQMSEPRRLAVLETAQHCNAIIFECDRNWELSYTGSGLRALQGYDPTTPVIYFGSLYETLGPHIRVGYLVVPSTLATSFSNAAQQMGCAPEPFILGALAKFIDEHHYARHIKNVRGLYAQRLSVLMSTLREHLPDAAILDPVGGLSVAVRVPADVDDIGLCRGLQSLNIPVAPLSMFYLAPDTAVKGVVLGFGTLPDRLADAAARRMGQVLADSRTGSDLPGF
jgi:GntR family transcriptional regulator/MocR family aminotransferase